MKNILFFGCGKMGSALVKNLLEQKFQAKQIKIIKRSENDKIAKLDYYKSTADLPSGYKADIVFIAIKPQNSAEILQEFAKAKIFHQNTIFISILAGKNLEFFSKIFGENAKIIRTMPNLPVQESQGITAFIANQNLTKTELSGIEKIFKHFGIALELENESYFDVITAIFGSGPAYIFLLQEMFYKISISFGLGEEESKELVKTLFLGSSLMSCNSDLTFLQLRDSVTSKGGTTEAAIDVIKHYPLQDVFKKAMESAIERLQTLSKT